MQFINQKRIRSRKMTSKKPPSDFDSGKYGNTVAEKRPLLLIILFEFKLLRNYFFKYRAYLGKHFIIQL